MKTFIFRLSPLLQKLGNVGRCLFSEKYLLFTNTAISVSLSLAGDILQQNYQILRKNMKTWNTTRMLHTSFSGLVMGPFCHYWYIFLDRWYPGRTFRVLFRKLMIDQVICSPVCIILYFGSIGMLERRSWKDIASESIVKGSTIYTMEWIVWPPAQVINFYLLPTRYRVLYDNVIGFGFDAYFSNIKYHSGENSQCIKTEEIMKIVDCSDYTCNDDDEIVSEDDG